MPSILLYTVPFIVPPEGPAPLDRTVAADFERFNGLEPLDNAPNAHDPMAGNGSSADYGFNVPGRYPRPGQADQPLGQVYTPGPLAGLTNTLGGQPLPVRRWGFNPPHDYTPANYPQSIQARLGTPQANPGVAQTVFFGELGSNPPQPEDNLDTLFRYG